MKIEYYRLNVYGNELIYCQGEGSEAIKELTGKKTIDKRDIKNLEMLGLELVEVLAPRKG